MAFWGWERWERELDWMALHGINVCPSSFDCRTCYISDVNKFISPLLHQMPLIAIGREVVMHRLLLELGMQDSSASIAVPLPLDSRDTTIEQMSQSTPVPLGTELSHNYQDGVAV